MIISPSNKKKVLFFLCVFLGVCSQFTWKCRGADSGHRLSVYLEVRRESAIMDMNSMMAGMNMDNAVHQRILVISSYVRLLRRRPLLLTRSMAKPSPPAPLTHKLFMMAQYSSLLAHLAHDQASNFCERFLSP